MGERKADLEIPFATWLSSIMIFRQYTFSQRLGASYQLPETFMHRWISNMRNAKYICPTNNEIKLKRIESCWDKENMLLIIHHICVYGGIYYSFTSKYSASDHVISGTYIIIFYSNLGEIFYRIKVLFYDRTKINSLNNINYSIASIFGS